MKQDGGKLLIKGIEENFTELKRFESSVIKVFTKCCEGLLRKDLYLESYLGKFVNFKDKKKSHKPPDMKKKKKRKG